MDPTTLALIVSHTAALAVGGLVSRWLVLRNFRVRDHDGHLALEVRHCDDPPD